MDKEKQVANFKGKGFKKGQSGNPAGRPPKGAALTDILISELNKKQNGKERKQILAEMLIEKAITEKDIQAIKYIFDRIDGKVTEKVQVTGDDGNNVTFDVTIKAIN